MSRPTADQLAEVLAERDGAVSIGTQLERERDAATTRADLAEAAMVRLREAMSDLCGAVRSSLHAAQYPLLSDALFEADQVLGAPDTELAKAQHNKWLADGMDKAATDLVEEYRKRACQLGHVDEGTLLADLYDDITDDAAELREGK